MAKIEGNQNIPSEILDAYRATLTEKQPDDVSRKRYPYRVPHMQKTGADVTTKQLAQRTRFLQALSDFNKISEADRQRWYAARPPWSSLLWYYNYFIMSSLAGNADIKEGGAGVIKSIQNIKDSIPTGGKTVAIPNAVDPTKTIVMLWGASYHYNVDEPVENVYVAWAWTVYPVWSNLQTTSVDVNWSIVPAVAANISVQVIEYI